MVAVERLVEAWRREPAAGDADLLRRVGEREAGAFEILVRRHSPAVLAAARAVLAEPADVEDVFQTAFLALWRKPDAIRRGSSLGCWLYGTARRAALKVHARTRRRREVEAKAPLGDAVAAPDLSWGEACRLLHAEIDRLPAAYREPIVLCHLMGRTRDEAARDLGCGLPALRGRLERGRAMLAKRLARRGVALSAGLLVTLPGNAASAALVERTLAAARDVVPAAGLATKLVALAAIVLIGVGTLAGFARRTADAVPAMPGEPPPMTIAVTGRVIARGQPVAGAKVEGVRFGVKGRATATSGADGRFALELPPGAATGGRVVAAAEGFAPAILGFDGKAGDLNVALPDAVDLTGRLRTLEGRPVAGATVSLLMFDAFAPGDFDKHLAAMVEVGDRHPMSHGKGERSIHFNPTQHAEIVPWLAKPVTTDAEGRFRLRAVGADRLADLAVSGPGIPHQRLVVRTQSGKPIEIRHADPRHHLTLHANPVDLLVKPARSIAGVVTLLGKPVTGAKVYAEGTTASAVTDAAGRYEIPGVAKTASYKVTASPPADIMAFGAERAVPDGAGLGPVAANFELKPSLRLTGRVIDGKTGAAVGGGTAEYFPLPGNGAFPKRDAGGVLHRWQRAETKVAADGTFALTVAPGPGIVAVRGDAAKHVEAFLDPRAIFPGEPFDRSRWGDTDMLFAPMEAGQLIRSQQDFRALEPINPKPDAGALSLTVKLTPGVALAARFVAPDGTPLAGVYTKGMLSDRWGGRNLSGPVKTHEFAIKGLNPRRPLTFYAVHEATGLCGQFTVSGTEAAPLALKLEPGATLTGRLLDAAGKPSVGARVSGMWSKPGEGRYWSQNPPHFPETDAEGRFRVPWLIPGHDLMLGAVPARTNLVRTAGGRLDPLKPGAVRDLGDVTLEP